MAGPVTPEHIVLFGVAFMCQSLLKEKPLTENPNNKAACVSIAVGGGEHYGREEHTHPNLPGLQRLRTQSKQLAEDGLDPPLWGPAGLHRSQIHPQGL